LSIVYRAGDPFPSLLPAGLFNLSEAKLRLLKLANSSSFSFGERSRKQQQLIKEGAGLASSPIRVAY